MKPDFNKNNGLLPVIIQDDATRQVLMLGYMNEEALKKTQTERLVTFYSRSRRQLWTKGETSGNFLQVKQTFLDCDADTLLITVTPKGPVCHSGSTSCFNEDSSKGFLYCLEKTISERIAQEEENSYTYRLFQRGINKIAQKVGEEATELIIEAKDENKTLFLNEAADLLYHLLILLKAKFVSLEEVERVLKSRSNKPGQEKKVNN